MTLHAAVYLFAPDAVLTQRVLDRASQGRRADDRADVIRHRLRVYAETTGPLVPYYEERGILIAVDADQSPDSVTADIQAGLSGLSLPGLSPGHAEITAPGTADTSHLLVRLGRLAFSNPTWTPASAQHAPLRDPADLAPDAAQAAEVLSAIHHTVATLACVASADQQAVDAALHGARLFMRTRALPEYFNVPYKYGHAALAKVTALLDAYQAASDASVSAVTGLDAVALAMNAPSWTLAVARAASHPVHDTSAADTAPGPPRQPARTTPSDLNLTASPSAGPVEQALRKHGADPIMMLRAIAIDRAARHLITEAKESTREAGPPGPAKGKRRPRRPATTPARIAARNFPASPSAPKAGRKSAASTTPGSPSAEPETKPAPCREYIAGGRLRFP